MKKLLALAAPAALVVALAGPVAPTSAAPASVTAADFPTAKQVVTAFPEMAGVKREIRPGGTLARVVDCTSAVPVKPRKSRAAVYATETSDVSVVVGVTEMKSVKQAKQYVRGARVMNTCGRVEIVEVEFEFTSRTIGAPKLGSERVGQAIDYGYGFSSVAYTFRKGTRVVEVTAVGMGGKPSRTALKKVARKAYRLGLAG